MFVVGSRSAARWLLFMSLNLFFLLVLFLSTWTLDQFRRVCGNSFSSCFLVCPIAADKSEPMKVVRRSIFLGPCDDIFTLAFHIGRKRTLSKSIIQLNGNGGNKHRLRSHVMTVISCCEWQVCHLFRPTDHHVQRKRAVPRGAKKAD